MPRKPIVKDKNLSKCVAKRIDSSEVETIGDLLKVYNQAKNDCVSQILKEKEETPKKKEKKEIELEAEEPEQEQEESEEESEEKETKKEPKEEKEPSIFEILGKIF